MSIFRPGKRELTGSFHGEPEREAQEESKDRKDPWWSSPSKEEDDDE